MSVVNDELLAGFEDESRSYLRNILAFINGISDNDAATEGLDDVLQHIGWIKGTSSFLGFPVLVQISQFLENVILEITQGSIAFDEDAESCLKDMVRILFNCVNEIESEDNAFTESLEFANKRYNMFMGRREGPETDEADNGHRLERPGSDSPGNEDHSAGTIVVGPEAMKNDPAPPQETIGAGIAPDGDNHSEALDVETPAGLPGFVSEEPAEGLEESWSGQGAFSPPPEVAPRSPEPVEGQPDGEGQDVPGLSGFDSSSAAADNGVSSPEESAALEDIPPELVEVFEREAREHLISISTSLSELESDRENLAHVQDVRRAVHTLKGVAGMIGYHDVSKLAHRMEDLLDGLYEGSIRLTDNIIRLMFKSSDVLEDILGSSSTPGFESTLGALYVSYDYALLDDHHPGVEEGTGDVPAGAYAPPPSPPTPTPTPPKEMAGAPYGPMEPPSPDSPRVYQTELPHPRETFISIPIDRLDHIVNSVGELIVSRSVFQEQLERMSADVAALKSSVELFRETLTELEPYSQQVMREFVPARAQVASLAAVPGDFSAPSLPAHGFDELEFDTYSDFQLAFNNLIEHGSKLRLQVGDLSSLHREFDNYSANQMRLAKDIQTRLMNMRMVKLSTVSTQLRRSVRVTAEQTGKLVDLYIVGEEVELDKAVIEQIIDPLIHILRNAVYHGIETPEVRATAAGKPPRGSVTLRAYHEGTQVVLEVGDDGAGINREKIREQAISLGFATEQELDGLTPEELYSFIHKSGFTTADELTEISGRGVGMDIVDDAVEKLKGSISIESVPGSGTKFTIRIPATLGITRALMVAAGDQVFAIPVQDVSRILQMKVSDALVEGRDDAVMIEGKEYTVKWLGELLGLAGYPGLPSRLDQVLILNIGKRRVALVVDDVIEDKEIVVKSLGSHMRRVFGFSGATLTGDGRVMLILNVADFASAKPEVKEEEEHPAPIEVVEEREVPVTKIPEVLVVDDSVSMRMVLTNTIVGAGWTAVTAMDGLAAKEYLEKTDRMPDILLLDLEMPRMDGYELTSYIRSSYKNKDIPIVILTSRAGEHHRQKAFDLGATEYLVKPFHTEHLCNLIAGLTSVDPPKLAKH